MTLQQGSLEGSPTVRVFFLLGPNVGTHLLQFAPHRRDRVAPGPEVLAGAVALLASELPGTCNGALALQEPEPLRHGILGRNGDTHMDLLGHDMARDDLTLFLAGQCVEDRAQRLPDLPLQLLPPSLGNKDDVILAIPSGMRQALITVFHESAFGLLIKPPEEDYSRIGQTSSSHTGRTSGLPSCSVK